ncbi:MAG TPA: hypothetical protein DCQ32_00355 [Cyanobacteria bacterium UBA8156]|nr:hypothetical protein [Cyanobacteria bacterium UBA8156]
MPNGNGTASPIAPEVITCVVDQATVHVSWPLRETKRETIPWPTVAGLGCVISGLGLGPQPQAAFTVITYAGDRPVLQSTFTLVGRHRVVVARDWAASPHFALWQRRHHQAIAEFGAQAEQAVGAYLLRQLQPVAWAIALAGWVPVAIDSHQQRGWGAPALAAIAWGGAIYGIQRWGARWLQRQIFRVNHRFSTWILAQILRHARLL